jgi:hypothetical protein
LLVSYIVPSLSAPTCVSDFLPPIHKLKWFLKRRIDTIISLIPQRIVPEAFIYHRKHDYS